MCRLEGRSPGLGGVGTGSVRAVLMPAAVASSNASHTLPRLAGLRRDCDVSRHLA